MKILLVEDNHLFGEYLAAHIDGVTAVDTLGGAMEMLNHERFDLLLVDLGLPDSRGLNTLTSFSHIKTPKIVITATDTYINQAAQMGWKDYITKGDLNEVVKRIRFNMGKIAKKRIRFAPEVFEAIQRHLTPVEPTQWIHA